MKFGHENLDVYKLSMELVHKIYKLSKKFPKDEQYSLTAQLKRSITSIPLNIAEGSAKRSKKDFARFVKNALGSLVETNTNLQIALQEKFITEKDYKDVEEPIQALFFKLVALRKSLEK